MKKIKKGDIVPYTANNKKIEWAIILDYYTENCHIIEHIGISIYKALLSDSLTFIDDIGIYNGQELLIKQGLNNE